MFYKSFLCWMLKSPEIVTREMKSMALTNRPRLLSDYKGFIRAQPLVDNQISVDRDSSWDPIVRRTLLRTGPKSVKMRLLKWKYLPDTFITSIVAFYESFFRRYFFIMCKIIAFKLRSHPSALRPRLRSFSKSSKNFPSKFPEFF